MLLALPSMFLMALVPRGRKGMLIATVAVTTIVAGGASLIPVVTSDDGSSGSALMGWQLTVANIGLAPFGLSCASLPAYTTNPIPAGTTIYRKRIAVNDVLDLNAGGITISQSCIQQTSIGGGTPEVMIESYTPPNPNIIIDSEIDGSLVPQQEVSKACALRGIWQEISRTYVHDVGSGICLVSYDETITTDVLVENNRIDSLRGYGDPASTGSHNEAATSRCFRVDLNPSRTQVWRGNWIETYSTGGTGGPGSNDSAGFFLQAYQCNIGNLYIQDNYMTDPGNYDLYADENGSAYVDSSTFELTNNRFGPNGFGGGWCAISGFTFDSQSENYVYDGSNPPNYDGAAVTC